MPNECIATYENLKIVFTFEMGFIYKNKMLVWRIQRNHTKLNRTETSEKKNYGKNVRTILLLASDDTKNCLKQRFEGANAQMKNESKFYQEKNKVEMNSNLICIAFLSFFFAFR